MPLTTNRPFFVPPLPLEFLRLIGGTSTEFGTDVAIDSNQNVYFIGKTFSQGQGSGDCLIVKYNSSDVIQTQKVIGVAGHDALEDIVIDSNDNIYVCGTTDNNALWIAKFNTSLSFQWQRKLDDFLKVETGFGIALDSNENPYVVGSATLSVGSREILIARYSTSGNLSWKKVLGGSSTDEGRAITIDSNDGIYITGYTQSEGEGSEDIVIAKYDINGTIQWQRTLGGTGGEQGHDIAVDSNDNVYVAGNASSGSTGSLDLVLAKYNSSGTLQWQRLLGGTSIEYGRGVIVNGNDVYLTGFSQSEGAGSQDIAIAKYDTNGVIQWQRLLGGTVGDAGLGSVVSSSGDIYIVGNTSAAGAGGNDMLVARLFADGSGLGTYGAFTYQGSTLTDKAATLTSATSTLTDATPSQPVSSGTGLSNATGTLTETVIL